jgi:hypothetical protein
VLPAKSDSAIQNAGKRGRNSDGWLLVSNNVFSQRDEVLDSNRVGVVGPSMGVEALPFLFFFFFFFGALVFQLHRSVDRANSRIF